MGEAQTYTKVSFGIDHVLAITSDLTAVGWGKNTNNESVVPPAIEDSQFTDIVAGWGFSMGLDITKRVVFWGKYIQGFNNLTTVVSVSFIAAGFTHAVIATEDGTIVAEGNNTNEQLQVPEIQIDKVLGLSAARNYTLAIIQDGSVIGWGGSDTPALVAIPEGLKAIKVSAGRNHALAIKQDGTVVGWGNNSNGQITIPEGLIAIEISAGSTFSAAIRPDNSVVVWGESFGPFPEDISAKSISAGSGSMFVVTTDGEMKMFGVSTSGFNLLNFPKLARNKLTYRKDSPRNEALQSYIPDVVPTGFEIRPFQLNPDSDIVPAYLTVLPKGTLLFRGTNETRQFLEDFAGKYQDTSSKKNMYCCIPSYYVYFYPFPFIDAIISNFRYYTLYYLTRDVTLDTLISPSPHARADRILPDMPHLKCSDIPMECEMVGRPYDPCFRPEFQAQNPDVVGMISIASADRANLWRESDRYMAPFKDYFSWYTDSHSVIPAVPEIILTPYKRALETKVRQHIPVANTFLKEKRDEFNYLPFYSIARTDDNIKRVVDSLLSTKGLKHQSSDRMFHAKINRETGFMQILEFSEPFPMSDTVRFTDPAFRFVRPPATVTR
jgi:alpha-tubulin suppressor-like RCC1 family protein